MPVLGGCMTRKSATVTIITKHYRSKAKFNEISAIFPIFKFCQYFVLRKLPTTWAGCHECSFEAQHGAQNQVYSSFFFPLCAKQFAVRGRIRLQPRAEICHLLVRFELNGVHF